MRTPQSASHHPSHLEIEVKLEVRNVRKLQSQICDLGFSKTWSRSFEDNWVFDLPNHQLVRADSLLRLRQYSGIALLTFKGPRRGSRRFKIREELETEISSPEILQIILARLDFRLTFRYQKFRTVYRKERTHKSGKLILTLDETPIGNYIEIEGAQADIDDLALKLGYNRADYITDSYLQLYLKKKPRARKLAMIFPRRHAKNP